MSTTALRIRDLVKRFRDPEGGEHVVVDLPALDLGEGEAMAVSGESGTGKTTLLHVISGILPADAGTVEIAGEAMTGLSEAARDRLRARRIGYVFQTFNLMPTMTALENVELGMTFRPRAGVSAAVAAKAALERVGLSNRAKHRPHQLSVGQQQRVAIARARWPGVPRSCWPTSRRRISMPSMERRASPSCGSSRPSRRPRSWS